jgi:hypothetical protein
MADEVIKVTGLTELLNGFKKADAGLGREVRKSLIETGEIVKASAAQKAGSDIRNIGPKWSRMRLGMAGGSAVYVAIASRRSTGTPRPNLGGLLLDKAMLPAVDENKAIVEERLISELENLHQNAGLISSLHKLT